MRGTGRGRGGARKWERALYTPWEPSKQSGSAGAAPLPHSKATDPPERMPLPISTPAERAYVVELVVEAACAAKQGPISAGQVEDGGKGRAGGGMENLTCKRARRWDCGARAWWTGSCNWRRSPPSASWSTAMGYQPLYFHYEPFATVGFLMEGNMQPFLSRFCLPRAVLRVLLAVGCLLSPPLPQPASAICPDRRTLRLRLDQT